MSKTYAIDSFLEDNLKRYIDETAKLCAQRSVSAKGEGMNECATLVCNALLERGFEVERVHTPGNPIVLAHLKGQSERTLLFYNHYDVQPPEPLELWTTPPFEPTVRDGALYARGAKDDKGEFVARLAAVDAVRAAHGGILPCSVTFVVEGEEEIGSPNIVSFVSENLARLKCHGAIWEEGGTNGEGQPLLALGTRGILALELSAQTMKRDGHSGSAHMLPNAAWRLHAALASLRDVHGRILIPGFYDEALPPSELDKELLAALPSDEEAMRASFGIDTFLHGRSGQALKEAVFEPTCNIQGLEAGYTGQGMKTVIPARAVAKIDFRLVPNQDPDDIFEKLQRHLEDQGFGDVTFRKLGSMHPSKASPDHPLVALTRRAAEEVYGQKALVFPITGGSSPVYAFDKPLGIPVVTAGVGYGLSNRTHAPDEHVRLTDFLNGARQIARILESFPDLEENREL